MQVSFVWEARARSGLLIAQDGAMLLVPNQRLLCPRDGASCAFGLYDGSKRARAEGEDRYGTP